jgi:hypothetical protein
MGRYQHLENERVHSACKFWDIMLTGTTYPLLPFLVCLDCVAVQTEEICGYINYCSASFAAILLVATGTLGKIIQPLVERYRQHLTTVMRAEGVQQRSHEGPCVALVIPNSVHRI